MSTTPPTDQTRGFALAALGTLAHAGLVLGLFVLYVVYVPAAKKTFDEFGMTLPWATQVAIRLSNWVAEYWWALVPVLLFLGAGDFGLLAGLSARSRLTAWLWIAGVALALAVLAALTAFAIELPMMKLKEGLAR
jgi:type II secretory pathway component PulF